MPPTPVRQFLIPLGACLTLSGCVTPSVPMASPHETVINATPQSHPAPHHYLRTSRYGLVSATPRPDQQDLLEQIIDIRIPEYLSPNVQDAMDYALRRSGYRLCPGSEATTALFALPLPAVHYRLGPMPLNAALKVLAGNAWQMETDELKRQVCFKVKPTSVPSTTEALQ